MSTFEAADPTGPNLNPSSSGAGESSAEAMAGPPILTSRNRQLRPSPNKHGRQWRLSPDCLTQPPSPSCCA